MAAVSAVAGAALIVDEDGVGGVRQVDVEEHFFDTLDTGRHGHE